jgi:Zinc finger, C3HC4 type (RING finger)
VDSICGRVFEFFGVGFIFDVGQYHKRIEISLLSSAVLIGTVKWDSESQSASVEDVIAASRDVPELMETIHEQGMTYLKRAQVLMILAFQFGVLTVVAYRALLKNRVVEVDRNAARKKLDSYSTDIQEQIYCITCQDAIKEVVCLPCKHVVCCVDCWEVVRNKTNCMVCNTQIAGLASWNDR